MKASTEILATGVVSPEETLQRLREILENVEDENAFLAASLDFTRLSTGGMAAFLFERAVDTIALRASSFASPSGRDDLKKAAAKAAAGAFNIRASIREVAPVGGNSHAVLGAFFERGEEDEVTPSVMVLVLSPDRAPFASPIFSILHLITRIFSERGYVDRLNHMEAVFLQSTLLVDLFSRVSLVATYKDALHLLASELRDYFDCQRIAIGVGDAIKCRLDGLSGVSRIEAGSQGAGLLRAAMREALSVRKATAFPPIKSDTEEYWPAVEQTELLSAFHSGQSVTLPLNDANGKRIGAWTFLWEPGQEVTERKLELMAAAMPHVASLVELVGLAHPRGIRGFVRKYWVRASRSKKHTIVAVLGIVMAVFLFPVAYRVPASCEVQPYFLQQVAAPFDGVLEKTFVRPGDQVEKGQLLAKLDGREIGWRLSQAVAQREIALKKRNQAQAGQQDIVAAQMAGLEADAAGLDVSLLEFQKRNLEVRAPSAGYLLTGDLERSEGVPVTLGQKLFDIAPIEILRLEISVPDSEIRWVEGEMKVSFRLEALPHKRFEAVVEKVYPVSEIVDGENVFVALARVDNSSLELRPGMRGRARVISKRRCLGWILFHKPWDYVRVRL
ncbi:MAG: efflux RND transporter periplasmic adaptor subunit [Verrucomicrobiales bacterium]|nr:efflux RND transporter periplasmic adaptor subunit [Verrucomicrobiales bacterium]